MRHSVTYLASFCDNLLDILVTNICHYFDLLDFVYRNIHYNVRLNTLNSIKSDIKDKTTLHCAFQYTLLVIIKRFSFTLSSFHV